jgi:hypothetical protein
LLQNSIATLQQESVSNKQIKESIRVIKEKMQKIRNGATRAQAPAAPANNARESLLDKY